MKIKVGPERMVVADGLQPFACMTRRGTIYLQCQLTAPHGVKFTKKNIIPGHESSRIDTNELHLIRVHSCPFVVNPRMHVTLEHYLVVSALLFCLGVLGVIMRRNLIVMYMSLELMLNAANLALVAFSRFNNNLNGQVMVFFIITVAAAEVAVGLALIVALYRKRQTAHVEDLTTMKY